MAAAAALAAPMMVGTVQTAAAQSGACRYDDSGTVCVCRGGGRWRIAPYEACRRSVGRPPVPYRDRRDYGAPRDRYAADRYDRDDDRYDRYDDYDDHQSDVYDDGYDDYAGSDADQPRQPTPEELQARAEVADIQSVLNALGCDAGPVDGLVGRRTRAAVACFQSLTGQSETGVLTIEQREALLSASAESQADRSTLVAELRETLGAPEIVAEAPGEDLFEDDERYVASAEDASEEAAASAGGKFADNNRASGVDAPTSAEADIQQGSLPEADQDAVAAACSAGAWRYVGAGDSAGVVASTRTVNGGSVAFRIFKDETAWLVDVTFDNRAVVASIIEEAQYLFLQTDQPAAIGFEDVAAFQGETLRIPVGFANTTAMLDSDNLTLASASRGPTSDGRGRLTLNTLAALPTDGLREALDCFD